MFAHFLVRCLRGYEFDEIDDLAMQLEENIWGGEGLGREPRRAVFSLFCLSFGGFWLEFCFIDGVKGEEIKVVDSVFVRRVAT